MSKGIIGGELKSFEMLTPTHRVEIPLEEYKRYIESTIKGPTVEIPLGEYDRLREKEIEQERQIIDLRYQVDDLMQEVNKRADVKAQIDQAFHEMRKLINVTESDTSKESEVK